MKANNHIKKDMSRNPHGTAALSKRAMSALFRGCGSPLLTSLTKGAIDQLDGIHFLSVDLTLSRSSCIMTDGEYDNGKLSGHADIKNIRAFLGRSFNH